MAVTLIKGLYAEIEYSLTGTGDWRKIPGVTEYTESGGERPTEEITTFDGSATIAGLARAASITANAQGLPHHQSWVDLRSAFVNGTAVWVRITTQEENVFSVTSDAGFNISSSGVFTKTGGSGPDFTSEDFAPGLVVKSGNGRYVIDTISNAGAITINPRPTSTVTVQPTSGYSVVTPSIRRTFRADVAITDRMSVSAEGTVTNTLTLTSKAQLPPAVIV